MQNIDISKLIQVKLDFSFVQDALSVTIKDIYQKISKLENSNIKMHQKTSQLDKQTHKLYQQLQKTREAQSQAYKILQDKIKNIPSIRVYQNQTKVEKPLDIIQKTPKQVLDHIENRLQLNFNSQNGRQVDLNCSPSNTERVMQTFRVKQSPIGSHKDQKDLLDQKVYSIYEMAVQRIEAEITQLRKDFRSQMNQITNKSMKIIDGKLASQANQIQKIKNQNIGTLHKIQFQNQPLSTKSHKVVIISQKNIQKEPVSTNKINNTRNGGGNDNGQLIPEKKSQLCQFIAELKKEVKIQLQEMVKNAEQKFDQISKTNSIIADHIVQAKKSMEDLTNEKDSLKIQMASIRQKSSSSQRQLCLMIDTTNEHKNKFKSLQSNLARLSQQLKDIKIGPDTIKQQRNQDDDSSVHSSKKQIFRDSQISFRSSIGNNLGPIRNNSILKLNNGKVDVIQQTIRNINGRVSSLFERVNKMEDQKKKYDLQQFGSSLPKIQKENRSNVNPIQLIKKQLKKVNEDIIKTNQKLTLTKDRLNQLYQSHLEIPNKIQDLYIKLRQSNQLQQDRLIQLIKQLINRMLSDPFDNNFTNRLKRQINVKFLQIKYEYNCILKQIEGKVQNRAEIGELQKVSHKFQQNLLEVKAIANRKCETEDLRKGLKYLQGKIKQVFNFAKNQTVALANQQKQYIGAKKQPLH